MIIAQYVQGLFCHIVSLKLADLLELSKNDTCQTQNFYSFKVQLLSL